MRLPDRTFWIANVAGWSGYVLLFVVTSIPLLKEPSLAKLASIAPYKAAMGLGGFLVSIPLYFLFESLEGRGAGTKAFAALLASLPLGVLWAFFVRRVMEPDSPMVYVFKGGMNYAITLLAWSALYLTFSYQASLEKERERSLRATALASEARLQMLRYQVNPHFLFNALNSIRALVDEDPKKARVLVTELAEFFRYSLVSGRNGDAPLAEELEAVKNYLAIQKIRFEERLETSFEVAPDAAATRLPSFLVHPLVENAVKYGMETSPMPLRIRVEARREGRTLTVVVANTGTLGAPASTASGLACDGTGTGLSNVRERLKQLFPERHTFSLTEQGGEVSARLAVTLTETA